MHAVSNLESSALMSVRLTAPHFRLRVSPLQIDLKDVSSSSKISIKVRPADKIEGQ